MGGVSVGITELSVRLLQMRGPYAVGSPGAGRSGGVDVKAAAVPVETAAASASASASESMSRGFDRAAADEQDRVMALDLALSRKKNAIDGRESIRLSREKGELWIYNSNDSGMGGRSYKVLNQPADLADTLDRMEKSWRKSEVIADEQIKYYSGIGNQIA